MYVICTYIYNCNKTYILHININQFNKLHDSFRVATRAASAQSLLKQDTGNNDILHINMVLQI